MRTLILGSILIVVAIATQSQEAKVILLSSPDATEAEITYHNLQAAQTAWDKEVEKIRDKYLLVGYGDKDAGSEISSITGSWAIGNIEIVGGAPHKSPTNEEIAASQAREVERQKQAKYQRKGWDGQFEFSSDFRFIVPKKVEWKPTNTCNFLTPAYTTPLGGLHLSPSSIITSGPTITTTY